MPILEVFSTIVCEYNLDLVAHLLNKVTSREKSKIYTDTFSFVKNVISLSKYCTMLSIVTFSYVSNLTVSDFALLIPSLYPN